jgi:hypothetical protein
VTKLKVKCSGCRRVFEIEMHIPANVTFRRPRYTCVGCAGAEGALSFLDKAEGELREHLATRAYKDVSRRWAKTHSRKPHDSRHALRARAMKRKARKHGYQGFSYNAWLRVVAHFDSLCQDCKTRTELCCDYRDHYNPLCARCMAKKYH